MDFDPGPYAEGIRRRNEAERKILSDRRELGLVEARRLAGLIKLRDPGVQKVILFGSVAEDSVRSIDFDIDLAIVGGDVYVAEDAVAGCEFKVDIADFSRLPEHVRSRILERGIELEEY